MEKCFFKSKLGKISGRKSYSIYPIIFYNTGRSNTQILEDGCAPSANI